MTGQPVVRPVLRETVRLMRRTVALLRQSIPAAPVLAFGPHLLFALLGAGLQVLLPAAPGERDALIWTGIIVAFAVAWAAVGIFALAVLVRLAEARSEARPFDPDGTLEIVAARYPRLAVSAVAYLLLVAVGFALLIVPGFVLAARLLLFPQAILREYQGPLAAIRRSWQGTRPAGPVVLAAAPALLVVLLLAAGGAWLDLAGQPLLAAVAYALAAGTATLAFAYLGAAAYARRLETEAVEAREAERAEAARVAEGFRYTCPSCSREYVLPSLPPEGTVCPACRTSGGG